MMMLGAAPMSHTLTEGLSKTCSATAVDEQAQFQQSLLQAASVQGTAPPVAGPPVTEVATVPPTSEVSRTATQASPLGDRILQNLSSMYRINAVPKGVEPGPASEPLLLKPGAPEAREPVAPHGAGDFEAMMANLKDVSDGVIQVTLISNGIGSLGSSLNKLMSAG
ncbi:nodulation protein NolB [Bradyrhizobium sp. Ec3.3]|uniref:nodulation protein NolB n=1 Tax=Bradyrhizobium sp. Ec3.3 TaxID=189753 RepID=UPI001FD90E60|nr:nodulation protein NolB [Bradyrhizobium sp. Ec3.3]